MWYSYLMKIQNTTLYDTRALSAYLHSCEKFWAVGRHYGRKWGVVRVRYATLKNLPGCYRNVWWVPALSIDLGHMWFAIPPLNQGAFANKWAGKTLLHPPPGEVALREAVRRQEAMDAAVVEAAEKVDEYERKVKLMQTMLKKWKRKLAARQRVVGVESRAGDK